MKTNLKNRPKVPDHSSVGDIQTYLTKSNSWFEEFEKELRELLDRHKICVDCEVIDSCATADDDCPALRKLEEILGIE